MQGIRLDIGGAAISSARQTYILIVFVFSLIPWQLLTDYHGELRSFTPQWWLEFGFQWWLTARTGKTTPQTQKVFQSECELVGTISKLCVVVLVNSSLYRRDLMDVTWSTSTHQRDQGEVVTLWSTNMLLDTTLWWVTARTLRSAGVTEVNAPEL